MTDKIHALMLQLIRELAPGARLDSELAKDESYLSAFLGTLLGNAPRLDEARSYARVANAAREDATVVAAREDARGARAAMLSSLETECPGQVERKIRRDQ